MGVEVYAITGFVVAILGALGHFIQKAHFKKCKTCCCESDCRDNIKLPHSPSPLKRQPKATLNDIMAVLARIDVPPTIAENRVEYENPIESDL